MSKDLKERFISSNPEHISDKKVCYITYAYLLSVSNFDTDKDLRYVTDSDIANLRIFICIIARNLFKLSIIIFSLTIFIFYMQISNFIYLEISYLSSHQTYPWNYKFH